MSLKLRQQNNGQVNLVFIYTSAVCKLSKYNIFKCCHVSYNTVWIKLFNFFVSNFLRSSGSLSHGGFLSSNEFCQFFVASHAILLAAVRQTLGDLFPTIGAQAGGVGLQRLLQKLLLVGWPGCLQTKQGDEIGVWNFILLSSVYNWKQEKMIVPVYH